MLTRGEAASLCEGILGRSPADATELVLTSRGGNSLRLAESGPSEQNALEEQKLCIRVERDGSPGRAETSSLGREAVDRALAAAFEAARHAPPCELPPLVGSTADPDGGQDEATARAAADHGAGAKVRQTAGYLGRVRESAAVATGFYETQGASLSYATSAGCFRHAFTARSWFSSTVLAGDGAGVAHDGSLGSGLDDDAIDRVGSRALAKALGSRSPRDVDPGVYRVLLEPQAVGDLLLFLSWAGLSGRDFIDGKSFLTGKVGDRVLSHRVTLRDDCSLPCFRAPAFDLEGETRRAVTLVEGGLARGPVFDRVTAAEAGTETTGHAGLQPSPEGPQATCLALEPSGPPDSDLLAKLGSGLLVTQFHYVNLIDPLPVTLTGMTRNGTFLVEDGEIVGPVRNLRFTQSLVEALAEVDAVGDDGVLVDAFFTGVARVPSLVLPAFRFTSSTEF